jgi:hypothetical protein
MPVQRIARLGVFVSFASKFPVLASSKNEARASFTQAGRHTARTLSMRITNVTVVVITIVVIVIIISTIFTTTTIITISMNTNHCAQLCSKRTRNAQTTASYIDGGG